MHNKPRILFVLKYREAPYENDWECAYSDGYLSSGLLNSARMASEMLEKLGYDSKLVQVIDNNYIHRAIVEHNADIVIIEAFWVVPEKFDELKKACPNVLFVIRNHSDIPFLSNEGIAMEWILEYLKRDNVIMTSNSDRMHDETRFLAATCFPNWSKELVNYKVSFLPNYYPVGHVPHHHHDSDVLDVGCFGAIRPLKNHLIQAVAAMKLATKLDRPLRFHVNGTRIEGNGSPILKNLEKMFDQYDNFELVKHCWLLHDEFKHELIPQMSIVTQVSFSETFNIVAADAVTMGVPIVVSKEVPWASKLFIADPTDSDDTMKKMERALNFGTWFPSFKPNVSGLKHYCERTKDHWEDFLEDHFAGGWSRFVY